MKLTPSKIKRWSDKERLKKINKWLGETIDSAGFYRLDYNHRENLDNIQQVVEYWLKHFGDDKQPEKKHITDGKENLW
jgi:hypothetical protein